MQRRFEGEERRGKFVELCLVQAIYAAVARLRVLTADMNGD